MLVRYADDGLVLCRDAGQAQQVKQQLQRWLEPRGLAFNQAKTKIVHLDDGVDFLSFTIRRFGAKLQKGAGPLVKEQAAEIIHKLGARALGEFAKLHFRTAYEVVSAAGKLDELPLPVPAEKTEWRRA